MVETLEDPLGFDLFHIRDLTREILDQRLCLSADSTLSSGGTGQPLDQSVLLTDQTGLLFQLAREQLDATGKGSQILLDPC